MLEGLLLRRELDYLIYILHQAKAEIPCPVCGPSPGPMATAPGYDGSIPCDSMTPPKACEVCHVHCWEYRVTAVQIPWAKDGAQLSTLFEGFVIEILGEDGICRKTLIVSTYLLDERGQGKVRNDPRHGAE